MKNPVYFRPTSRLYIHFKPIIRVLVKVFRLNFTQSINIGRGIGIYGSIDDEEKKMFFSAYSQTRRMGFIEKICFSLCIILIDRPLFVAVIPAMILLNLILFIFGA